MHCVVGSLKNSLYAPHSDFGELLCSPDGSPTYHHVQDDKWLPKRDEMQVVTIVISNSVRAFSTELVYSAGSTELATIPLSSCCIHIQGPGSQSQGIKHCARVTGSNVDGAIWRSAITLRLSVGRNHQPDLFRQLLGEMLLTPEPPQPA